MTTVSKLKVYTLFPVGGKFSVKTADYRGEKVHVMAVSVKQALYKAYQNEWADSPRQAGIVETYSKYEQNKHADWMGNVTHGMPGLAQHGMSPAQLERQAAEVTK